MNEDTFKQIYSQFFPHGGEVCVCVRVKFVCQLHCVYQPAFFFAAPDASAYAHYLFNAFDTGSTGSIKFEVWFVPSDYHISSHCPPNTPV